MNSPETATSSDEARLIKPWKQHLLSPAGPFVRRLVVQTPNTLIKSLLAMCMLAFFSLCYMSIFPSCPGCYGHLTNGSDLPIAPDDLDYTDDKTNISHILFGIAGSAKSWIVRRHFSELWWEPNVTRGFVWLDQEPEKMHKWLMPVTKSPGYKVSADTSRFDYKCKEGSRSAVRITRIVKESFDLGMDNVRWFVVGDDDTVFFTEDLVSVLNKYDHREMYYIGANSESVEQARFHSYTIAYGGAGFAISYPLAAVLVRVLDVCINRYAELYGSDLKIGECMKEIGVPMTVELGFHQLDIRGNALGLLSTHPLAPLVSLHHLDYLDPLFPDMNRFDSVRKLISAYKHDPSRALQHTFCYDPTRKWSISVSWGYTVHVYPYLMRPKELSTSVQTFLTWAKVSGPFTFNTRMFKLDPCQRPVIFYLDSVEEFDNGTTLTRYKKLEDDDRKKKCGKKNYKDAYLIKGFSVSAGLFDPQLWNKAPRRQMCQVTSKQVHTSVNLTIRDFNEGESITPP